MSTVAEIKAAIPSLTLEERAEVARCLNQWQDDEWDEQMKRDIATGKLDKLLSKVDKDIAKGKLHDLP
jgi:ribosome recycling factor